MEKLQEQDIELLCEGRPALCRELEAVAEVWRLPAGSGDKRTMEKTYLLLGEYRSGQQKIIMSTPARGKYPDKVATWLFDSASRPPADSYIVIDKAKVGRPRRELTEEERQEIMDRHNAGEGINRIAREMKLGTKRVTAVIRG